MPDKRTSTQIAVEMSEIRSRVSSLREGPAEGQSADDHATALNEAVAKLAALEPEYRAAIVLDATELETREVPTETPEQRELRNLRERVSVGRYLAAGMRGARVNGAEEEFRQAVECEERQIPYEAFEGEEQPEQRADAATGVPGTIGINMTSLVPSVFAMSMADYLGIQMPRVPSGQYSIPRLTTDLTAGAKGKGDAQESTAAGFTVIGAKPKRISARLTLRAEDLAEVGIPAFEASLRENLRMVLADTVDNQIIKGDGSGDNLAGLQGQLTADAAQDAANTFANAASDLAGYVEGKFAHALSHLRVLHNPTVYAKLAALFATNDDSVTHLDWCNRHGIGVRNSANMAANSAGNVGKSIIVRSGAAKGAAGAGAVSPVWGNIAITDPYTGSASATQHVTLHILLGDVLVRYPGRFAEWQVKTA